MDLEQIFWKSVGFSSLEVSVTILDTPLLRLTFPFRPDFLIFCDAVTPIMQKKETRNGQDFCSDLHCSPPFHSGSPFVFTSCLER